MDASGPSPRAVSPVPVLAPPPAALGAAAFSDTSPRFNPFDRGAEDVAEATIDAKGEFTQHLCHGSKAVYYSVRGKPSLEGVIIKIFCA